MGGSIKDKTELEFPPVHQVKGISVILKQINICFLSTRIMDLESCPICLIFRPSRGELEKMG